MYQNISESIHISAIREELSIGFFLKDSNNDRLNALGAYYMLSTLLYAFDIHA